MRFHFFLFYFLFFFSSRRRHTRYIGDWSSDVCSSDLIAGMSWVTPLGSDVDDVWQQLLAGETAPVEMLENEQNGAHYLVRDRKSTRLNSSHRCISYAVFCLKKKKKNR